jgi:biotin operon repressor
MAGKRTWTDEQLEYLKEHAGKITFKQIAEDIGLTPVQIRSKAADLGLRNPIEGKWSEEEIQFLRDNARTMTYAEIGEKLGRSEKAVSKKAHTQKISGGNYTDEELEYIQEAAGSASLDHIAKKLDRSKDSVWQKMVELGCSDFHMEAGTYTANAFAELVGVSQETVRRWIRKGLPAVKKARQRGVDARYHRYHIEVPRFWKWAEENKDIIEFNKIEPDLLAPEPEWVMIERRKQYYKPAKQKIWTTGEDKTLLRLCYGEGLKHREIAERMGRTQNSIEKRLKRLRESGVTV